jgi:hypothetical protein
MHDFLRKRYSSYGVFGVTLWVEDIETAFGAVPYDVAARVAPDDGLFGTGARVPPDIAHGFWLEVFDSPITGRKRSEQETVPSRPLTPLSTLRSADRRVGTSWRCRSFSLDRIVEWFESEGGG